VCVSQIWSLVARVKEHLCCGSRQILVINKPNDPALHKLLIESFEILAPALRDFDIAAIDA
jgi:hypothetical protein